MIHASSIGLMRFFASFGESPCKDEELATNQSTRKDRHKKEVSWVGRIKKGGRKTVSGMLFFNLRSPCGTARAQSTVLKCRP